MKRLFNGRPHNLYDQSMARLHYTKRSLLKLSRVLTKNLILIALIATLFNSNILQGQQGGDTRVLTTEGFMYFHPDLRWRTEGLRYYENDEFDLAIKAFRRAASFGDKISQAMIAEMYWKGQGVAVDRPLSYVWMDLAAERKNPYFIGLRERYWMQLDEIEKKRALDVGLPIFDAYQDSATLPRLERRLSQGRRQITGSHLGFRGNVKIYIKDIGEVSVDDYYQDKYWVPKQYLEWQADLLLKSQRGRVEVGAPESE